MVVVQDDEEEDLLRVLPKLLGFLHQVSSGSTGGAC